MSILLNIVVALDVVCSVAKFFQIKNFLPVLIRVHFASPYFGKGIFSPPYPSHQRVLIYIASFPTSK